MTPITTASAESQPMRWLTAAQWFCLLVGLFLAARGLTTLLAGASFALPGDGWRALFQMTVAGALAAGLLRASRTRQVVLGVALLYIAVTALGDPGSSVAGVIPVDTRDKLVHPAIAVLGLLALAIPRLRRR